MKTKSFPETVSPDGAPLVLNGRTYPLWQQFIDNKAKWIGGTLEDFPDRIDRALGATDSRTTITNVILRANGTDSAWFEVEGKDFGCGFDVQFGGVGAGEPGWLTFYGYGGHSWRIKSADSPPVAVPLGQKGEISMKNAHQTAPLDAEEGCKGGES